jgi:hypothetical protein
MKTLITLALLCSIAHAQDHSYPGLDVVAGAARETTKEELCDPSFRTKSIRPSAHDTNIIKQALFDEMEAKGLVPPGITIADYELDHVDALTNGGFPGIVYTKGKVDVQASIKAGNLRNQPRTTYFEKESQRPESPWYGLDQPYPSAEAKDHVEVRTHSMMCAGKLTLKQAQVLSGEHWQYFFGCEFMQVKAACDIVEKLKARESSEAPVEEPMPMGKSA